MDSNLSVNDASRIDRTPRLFLAGVWAAMSIAALCLAWHFGLTSPYSDELRWLDVVAGQKPADAAWLVQLENLHCAPAVKLAYLSSLRIGGGDFRTPAILSVLLLSAAAAALLIAVGRLRGRAELLDVLIPATLMHFSHGINLTWGLQICYVLPVALACFLLAMLVVCPYQLCQLGATAGLSSSAGNTVGQANRGTQRLSLPTAALVSLTAAAAALCGGPGVFYLPPLCAWLVYGGLCRWKDNRAAAMVTIALAVAAAAPLVCWLPALRQTAQHAGGGGGPLSLPRGVIEYFSSSLGKLGVETHPVSGLLVLAALVAAFVVLWRAWRTAPRRRMQTAALAAFLMGCGLMALGTSAARAAIGCLQLRYALLAAPMLIALYLVAVGGGFSLRRKWTQRAAVAAILAVALLYDIKGWQMAEAFFGNVCRFETAAAEGFSLQSLAVRFAEDMQAVSEPAMLDALATMQQARLGPYRPKCSIAPPRDDMIVALHPPGNPFTRSPCRIETLAAGKEYVQTVSPLSLWERARVRANERASGVSSMDTSVKPSPLTPLPKGEGTSALYPLPKGEGTFALYRIDVKVGGRGRHKAAMHWSLDELAADGTRRRRAEGWLSAAAQSDPDYISLRFEPFIPTAGVRLQLRLCDQCAEGFRLRLPLYTYAPGRSGVFGFLYFQRPGGAMP